MDYEAQPRALPEGIDYGDHIIATYYAALPRDMIMYYLAPFLAIEQSTGTWTPVPGETPEVRAKHVAKVIGIHEAPYFEYEVPRDVDERTYVVQIAFPYRNIENQIPMMLTAVLGNISMGGKIKLLDIWFPKVFTDGFTGPRFGIEGVQEILGVKDRPLLNNMVKPCTGYTCEVGRDLFYEAALGGCDCIKDDELIADMAFNRVEDRVKAYMAMEKRVYEETGEHTLYTVNISDNIPKMFEVARRAVAGGANAIMVNYIAVGFPALQALAEDPEVNVPILAHMDCAGAWYESPNSGVASHLVLGKLPRLAGADVIVFPAPYGKAPYLKDRFVTTADSMKYPLHALKPSMPMPSGGITQSMVGTCVADLGNDIMIGSGGGIHAHPMGPAAGARAFRQAIDAVMKGIPLDDYAKEHQELAVALGIWSDIFTETTA
ncbi:MAG: ribulose 1,5-bisphosphate carboxylase [Actinobacteria bacterium RBG_19FT_COMBO_54_7]|uniref:Ribulose 1,5-bisphosphate carboxylase n=1 Tax=Candidatus Solincola sediminis TaxID=1797199 RepID=A0A1F2WMD2_9ACTN|nr:MAG: ribulose 1,5-bisphosphate carboxylase [Candidatus Solincola sediminis]OFW61360.1 MAG: ribulose 1,5-bisphosphate carboxylase [Candidatus Solincola sediminis]OFW70645.1 MAG: ribulose 1,5-bisphosphate carboxylase [Actinobacteria bacterium RBG_19FT_COMBO_54_7]